MNVRSHKGALDNIKFHKGLEQARPRKNHDYLLDMTPTSITHTPEEIQYWEDNRSRSAKAKLNLIALINKH